MKITFQNILYSFKIQLFLIYMSYQKWMRFKSKYHKKQTLTIPRKPRVIFQFIVLKNIWKVIKTTFTHKRQISLSFEVIVTAF